MQLASTNKLRAEPINQRRRQLSRLSLKRTTPDTLILASKKFTLMSLSGKLADFFLVSLHYNIKR